MSMKETEKGIVKCFHDHNWKSYAIMLLVFLLGFCLFLSFPSNNNHIEIIVIPREPFKSKQECYAVVDSLRYACESKGRSPILCVYDEYCDDRGCC